MAMQRPGRRLTGQQCVAVLGRVLASPGSFLPGGCHDVAFPLHRSFLEAGELDTLFCHLWPLGSPTSETPVCDGQWAGSERGPLWSPPEAAGQVSALRHPGLPPEVRASLGQSHRCWVSGCFERPCHLDLMQSGVYRACTPECAFH